MKKNAILSLGREFNIFVQLRLDQKDQIKIEDGLSFYILAAFLLFKYSGDPDFEVCGNTLIGMASDQMPDCDKVNFANGIAGVGWVIEQLSQNLQVIDLNTDDILEEVDSLIYKSVLYAGSSPGSISYELIGALFYFEMRKEAKHKGLTHPYKRLSIFLSLRMLSERIYDSIDACLDALHLGPVNGRSVSDIKVLIKIFHFVFSNREKTILTRPEVPIIRKIIDAISAMRYQELFSVSNDRNLHVLALQFLSLMLVLMGDQVGLADLRQTGESLYGSLSDHLNINAFTCEEIAKAQLIYAFCAGLNVRDDAKKGLVDRVPGGPVRFDFARRSSAEVLIALLLDEMKDVLNIYDLLIGTFFCPKMLTQ